MLNASETFQVVLTFDAAIETARMPRSVMDEYVRSRSIDLIAPYFAPGLRPQKFYLKRIANAEFMNFVAQGVSAEDKAYRAFRCSVVRVDNVTLPDGALINNWHPAGKTLQTNGEPFVTPEELAQWYPDEIAEIGMVAYTRSFLAPRRARIYALPPSSHDTLTATTFLPVVQKAAAGNNNAPSESVASATQENPTSDVGSVKPGDVHATG